MRLHTTTQPFPSRDKGVEGCGAVGADDDVGGGCAHLRRGVGAGQADAAEGAAAGDPAVQTATVPAAPRPALCEGERGSGPRAHTLSTVIPN
jgi:hypothetical protein